MPDHIRDMGRKIVEGESVSNPGMCSSRLWKYDETLDVLQNKSGTRNIEAIELLKYPELCSDLVDNIELINELQQFGDPGTELLCFQTESFAAMSQLRMLNLGVVTLEGGYEHIPRTVRWLAWGPPDLDFLPPSLCLDNIVILDLSFSSITQVWNQQGFASMKVFTKLRFLRLIYCEKLVSCPDFRSMPQLDYLDFGYCMKMSKLHPSIGLLKSLTHLGLKHCDSLMELPQEICQLTSLEILDLEECKNISTLPSRLGDLNSLRKLYLRRTRITTLPESVGQMKQLNLLSLENCSSLKKIPECIWSLVNLEELDVQRCGSLVSFPNMLGNLKKLRKLDLSGTDIEELSDSIMSLEKLEFLSVAGCGRLKFLPASVTVGSVLLTSDGASSSSGDQGNLKRSSVGERSNGLQYSLPQFPPSLTELYAQCCYELEMIADVSNAKGLRKLDLSFCLKLVDVPGVERLKWLNSLKLGGCRSLNHSVRKRVQEAIFERLTDFSISGNLCELSGALEGQILSFFVPKWFKTGSLYLKLGESSLHGVVVGIAITTTDDGRLLFSISIPARVWRPYDFLRDSDVPEVKLGEYGETMKMMHVLTTGCLLLDGRLRTTTPFGVCGDMYSDSSNMSSIVNTGLNFGEPIPYYAGLYTVLSVDFS